MIRKSIFAVALAAISLPALATTVTSPNGCLVLTTSTEGGKPVYSITYEGKTMVDKAPFGLKANYADFTKGLTLYADTLTPFNVDFAQDRIKHSRVKFDGTRLMEKYKNDKGQKIRVEWIVGNNDVAFRYLLPHDGELRSAIIEREATGFRFPEQTTTFLTPQSDAMIGWKRTKPSYEEKYTVDAPMSAKSQYGHGYTFPALFRVGNDGWVLVSETGVDGGYAASRLSDFNDGVYTIEFPMPEENNGNGNSAPAIPLDGVTPWRTLTVGADLKPIVETVIPWAPLNQLYAMDNVFNDGKGTWSWIIWQDDSINYDDSIAYIDLAASLGYSHALIDSGWDRTIGREGMAKLAKYAQDKGTNIAVWYSSSGWWNDIVQSPTNIMSRPIPRKQELKWLRDLGVKVIKVDFFGGDKQETMRLYEDILSDAADYGISVIFHGCTLPRGWERMYPNYVGSEAVLASENLVFGQEFCDEEAYNASLHPFIRNTVGSMEYGGTVLNTQLRKGNKGGTTRRTSDAFQLATSVLFQNAVQNFALTPESMEFAPADAIAFMKEVPATWDETMYVDGYPGKYVVLARRHADKWYIAGVSNLEKETKVKLSLPMLTKGQTVELYSEPDGKSFAKTALKIKNPEKVEISLRPNHGFVIVAK